MVFEVWVFGVWGGLVLCLETGLGIEGMGWIRVKRESCLGPGWAFDMRTDDLVPCSPMEKK